MDIIRRSLCAVSLSQKEKGSSSRPPSQQQPSQPQLKRPSSLTDLSHAHEEQEMEFLKLQVSEQRGIIDELTQVGISLSPPGSCACCVKCQINGVMRRADLPCLSVGT